MAELLKLLVDPGGGAGGVGDMGSMGCRGADGCMQALIGGLASCWVIWVR